MTKNLTNRTIVGRRPPGSTTLDRVLWQKKKQQIFDALANTKVSINMQKQYMHKKRVKIEAKIKSMNFEQNRMKLNTMTEFK